MTEEKDPYASFVTPRQKLEWIGTRLTSIVDLIDEVSDELLRQEVKRRL